ncbi:unnamed protein product [Calypogeia fissa]
MERAKEDIKDILKRNGKESLYPKILKDEDNPDSSIHTAEKEMQGSERLHKSRDWSIKKRYQDVKLAIQKARDEIVKKKYDTQKSCRNQIRLLGKKFLKKSLQQGMVIQHQLAIADRILSPVHTTTVLPVPELLDEEHPAKYTPYNWGYFLRRNVQILQ